MFSSFSGNLSGMSDWIQESSKKAASSLQKSVVDIQQGVTELMNEKPGIDFPINLFTICSLEVSRWRGLILKS